MKNRTPIICDRCRATGFPGEGDFAETRPKLDFAPVPRKYRHDGWTPERQRAFIEALASTGSVSLAAEAVNMSPEGAYYLRRQPGAEEFRAAWKAALDHGGALIDEAALERSIHGHAVPVFHEGRQVGEKRVYNERLTMFMLQHRMPEKYGNGIRGGTKAADTLLREASEAMERSAIDALERLARQYGNVVQLERRHRDAGDEAQADFYARQLTHIEIVFHCGTAGFELTKYANRHKAPANPWGRSRPAVPWIPFIDEYLKRLRETAWARAAEGKPLQWGGPKLEEEKA